MEEHKENHAHKHEEQPSHEHHAHEVHVEHHAHHKRKPTFGPIHTILAVLIAVVLLVNTVQILGINSVLSGEEPEKPEIKATLITADCEDCFDAKPLFDQLIAAKEFDVDHDTLPMTDRHSEKLMEAYGITKLPAIVIEGDVETLKFEGFTAKDGALVFESIAPYYDVTSGSLKGSVDIAFVKADSLLCPACSTENTLPAQLEGLGVFVLSSKVHAADSEDGKRLIDAYKLTKLPAYILSSGASEYEVISQAWPQLGDVADDGSFVMRTVQPPYYDLSLKKVRGELAMIGLADATCKECYNVSIHEQIFLSNFGAKFSETKLVDVSSVEGKNLLKQYNITKVPTVIVTGDTDAYEAIAQIWPQVGDVVDNALVFRNVDVLQGLKYKDLKTGQIVTATGQ